MGGRENLYRNDDVERLKRLQYSGARLSWKRRRYENMYLSTFPAPHLLFETGADSYSHIMLQRECGTVDLWLVLFRPINYSDYIPARY